MTDKFKVILFFLLFASVVVFGAEPEFYTSSKDLIGKKIGVLDGGITDQLVTAYNKEFTDFAYFPSLPDAILALKSKKIDAVASEFPVIIDSVNKISGIKYLPEKFALAGLGFGFRKNDPLKDKFEKALAKVKETEEFKSLEDIWFGKDLSKKVLPKQDWPATNGIIRYTGSGELEPMNYFDESGKLTGYDVAVILLVAKELQMHLETSVVTFQGMIPNLISNKTDLIGSSLTITEERLQVIDMVKYMDIYNLFAVRAPDDGSSQKGFWSGLRESFYRTFVIENRWLILLKGLKVTLLVSAGAGIIGVIISFIFILLRRLQIKWLEHLLEVFCKLIVGIPSVVFLMILYYVIFEKVDLAPALVAMIGFGISFGTSSYGLMKSGIDAVNVGQEEASLALGFTRNQSFFKVILPQAAKIFLPLMQGEFIGMVKMTSIIGYISGQDLTKATDIIRARTMEAFFPLITIAIIYFVLAYLLSLGLTKILKAIDPKQRARIIKGVK